MRVASVNPFQLARAELFTPWNEERVLGALDALLRDGFIEGEARYRLFGVRSGRAFTMSLGLPLLGGGTPVLRGRVREGAGAMGSTTLDVSAGARVEFVVFGTFWALLTVVGGGYQLLLQCRRVLAGEAGWGAVLEVLPGIALLAAIVLVGVGWWRRQQRPHALALIERLRLQLEATAAAGEALPFTARPIA